MNDNNTELLQALRTDFSDNAVSFVQGLRGTINERGKGQIVRGLVDQAVLDGDVGGEYLRAYIKERFAQRSDDEINRMFILKRHFGIGQTGPIQTSFSMDMLGGYQAISIRRIYYILCSASWIVNVNPCHL